MIKGLITNNRSRALKSDGEVNFFNIVLGVLQGDTPSPFLFILILYYVVRILLNANNSNGQQIRSRNSITRLAEFITDLHFADNRTIPNSTAKDVESLL